MRDADQPKIIIEPALIVSWHNRVIRKVLGVLELLFHGFFLGFFFEFFRVRQSEPSSWLFDVIFLRSACREKVLRYVVEFVLIA